MSFLKRCKNLICCCTCTNNERCKLIRKRLTDDHKYCGCRQSNKQRSKMKTCDNETDKIILVDEVVEALDYDFINEGGSLEECILEEPDQQDPIQTPSPDHRICCMSDSQIVAVPVTHEFPTALHAQSDITIQGTVHENAIRFAINLVIGRRAEPDVAFHFNPRLDQQYAARNSRLDGDWGHEEGNSQQRFPFRRSHPFNIEIFLTHSEFLVAVNGTHYCSYTYRTSLINITGLHVEGGVKLSRVHLRTTSTYPSPLPPECLPCPFRFPLLYNRLATNDKEITPVYGLLQENLKLNSVIEINGRVKLLPFSFFINLQEGSGIWPHPEIPLHISVRFSQGGDHVILANAWLQTGWGSEELTHTKCLFTPGYPFCLRISCSENAFVALVDDKPLLVFKHRVPFTNIDTLLVQGDVYIYNIRV